MGDRFCGPTFKIAGCTVQSISCRLGCACGPDTRRSVSTVLRAQPPPDRIALPSITISLVAAPSTSEKEPTTPRDGRIPSVLLITQFHAPEPCAAANRVGAMTKALQGAGFDVHVVTAFASFPNGVLASADRVLTRNERLGCRVLLTRVLTYASPKLSGRVRILNWLSVAFSATIFVMFTRRHFDVVIVTVPPITLALPSLVAMLRHRAKLVVDVRDVFPDVAVKMGYWQEGGAAVKLVGLLAATLYRAATIVLCVTESARAEITARSGDAGKVLVAANGFDMLEAAPTSPYLRKPGEFVAAFVGNMGLATGLDVIIDAAQHLQDERRIRFVVAGGGADEARLARRIANQRLDNVRMLGVVSRADANALIADADVSIVPLHPGIVDSLPTKMFDALVLGCPVVCCANGEARSFIEKSGGGIAVDPQDGLALAAALRELFAQPARRLSYASAGKRFVLEHFDRSKIMRDVAERIRRTVE